MTLVAVAIEQNSIQIITQKREFLEKRPVLAAHNRDGKLFEHTEREMHELDHALDTFVKKTKSEKTESEDQNLAGVVEELPDILLFAVQHWLFQELSPADIAEKLFLIEKDSFHHDHNDIASLAIKVQDEKRNVQEIGELTDPLLFRILSVCFAISRELGFDLYEISSIKESYNALRYHERLFSGKHEYPIARKISKRYERLVLPKKTFLYPDLLRRRRK